jgi:AcrR family transcriptional regulator
MNVHSFLYKEIRHMTKQGKELMLQLEKGANDHIPDKGTRQIVMAALDVFARKGLAGTKIKDIAEKAGFSQGFVYNYFKSKDEIFTKIVDLAADGAGAIVLNASRLSGTPYEKIYWLTEALLSPDSIAMQHWRLIMLQAATSEAVPEEAKRIADVKMRNPVEYLVPMLIEGQQAGLFVAGDPLVLAITYFSIIQGLGITRMQGGRKMLFPSTEMILCFLRTLSCPAIPAAN